MHCTTERHLNLNHLTHTHTSLPFKSASFGRGFLGPDVAADVVNEFVEMCHHLRVLNSVHMEEIGLPITLRQYPLYKFLCGTPIKNTCICICTITM